MADEKPFLSIPEAAKILGITRIAVFKQVKKSRLAAIRIGRNWAIPVSALETRAPDKSAPPPAARGGDIPAPPAKKIKSPAPVKPAERPPLKAEKDMLEDLGWD
ncbi:MAG: helix-turn-helix domain-containing protein [Elusimicrobia bacterium]|nr:helix-turn-helix domain-containing protein [Elusimicrobiota bacterium]